MREDRACRSGHERDTEADRGRSFSDSARTASGATVMGIRSLLFVVLSILSVAGVDVIFGRDKYDFGGHGLWLSWVSLSTIGLLCVTHTILAAVMWMQRNRWTPSESSMFRFMSSK